MKICVVGSTGMLGEAVLAEAHQRGHEVQGSPRVNLGDHGPYKGLDIVLWQEADVVINCAGVRPGGRAKSMILANALGPWELAQHTEILGSKLIHMSTDCVFSGRHDGLHSKILPDPIDLYGCTKRAGEPVGDHVLVVRGSFIGLRHGFLRWLLDAQGTVQAWAQAYWNGSTVWHMAEILVDLAEDFRPGTIHVAAQESVTKAWMAKYLVEKLDLPVNIEFVNQPKIWRALCPDIILPPIQRVLDEVVDKCRITASP